MTDPENSVEPMPVDLADVGVAADEFDRALPLEADPADVIEQLQSVEDDGEDYRDA